MLEFIVLGKIPGTHFNITYSWVLALAAGLLIMLEIRYHRNYALKVHAAAEAAALTAPKKRSTSRKSASKKPKNTSNKTAKRKTTTATSKASRR